MQRYQKGDVKKNEIMELSILTKDYNFLFFTKDHFQEYFLENKDLQRYHLILHNTDLYLNIIAEVADKLLMNGILKNIQSSSSNTDNSTQSNNLTKNSMSKNQIKILDKKI